MKNTVPNNDSFDDMIYLCKIPVMLLLCDMSLELIVYWIIIKTVHRNTFCYMYK